MIHKHLILDMAEMATSVTDMDGLSGRVFGSPKSGRVFGSPVGR